MYKCELCDAVSQPREKARRHQVLRDNGSISAQLNVCPECEHLLGEGRSPAEVRRHCTPAATLERHRIRREEATRMLSPGGGDGVATVAVENLAEGMRNGEFRNGRVPEVHDGLNTVLSANGHGVKASSLNGHGKKRDFKPTPPPPKPKREIPAVVGEEVTVPILGVPVKVQKSARQTTAGKPKSRKRMTVAEKKAAEKRKKPEAVPRYCSKCRVMEVQLYGEVVNKAGHKHVVAVRKAGCKHPAQYKQ